MQSVGAPPRLTPLNLHHAPPLPQISWTVTGLVAAAMLTQPYEANGSGEHSLSWVQGSVRGVWEAMVTGEWPAAAGAPAAAAVAAAAPRDGVQQVDGGGPPRPPAPAQMR
jgi:hypothetical protein